MELLVCYSGMGWSMAPESPGQMKEKGVLEHLFVKSGGTGAILIFKDVEEQEARALVSVLPLAPYFNSAVYTTLEKHF